MKRIGFRAGTVILALSFLACAAQAQSLGEIARKLSAERAQQKQKATKVYTNDNIPRAPSIELSTPTSAAEPATANSQSQSKSANGANNTSEKTEPSGASPISTSGAQQRTSGEAPMNSMKTKAYWQARFKEARAALALAKERQELDENELSLLNLQKVRDLNHNQQVSLGNQISTKQSELAMRRAETQKAQRALDELQKKFKESGAPGDWLKND